ncbi:rRNA maturation RNase YbeY [Chryseosolibacter indicus]|uniref:Endoribonuclease YbeY n=1 Tax=Chryseosolibacter indicus TaxID=2782351 RepID=A0ABS5VQP1_9BACT|nr:rRNA maturation RNase YbeY [Chryseosolibacter indicus]MBT1703117.1 rRNA maturation RNase YbeY [Chryseosolibacter indicus]
MPLINYFVEDVDFKIPYPRKTSNWISRIIKGERYKLKEINYIFCSDEYLNKINVDFLNHTSLTDIITFDNSSEKGVVESDIYISIERVKENSAKFNSGFLDELNRVMIHGVLHLLGYKDKTAKAKALMRKKEDACLMKR